MLRRTRSVALTVECWLKIFDSVHLNCIFISALSFGKLHSCLPFLSAKIKLFAKNHAELGSRK